MTTYLFPGQGAQKKGMGAGLFEAFPRLTALADDILGYSIQTLCLEDPDHRLGQTEYTQPALYVISCLDYLMTIQSRQRRPDAVLGHSLGEYAALFAAGAFDFATGLRLVQKRGKLMAQTQDGAMAAVLGLKLEQVTQMLRHPQLRGLTLANDNGPAQVVLSGLRSDIEQAQTFFEGAGAIYLPLPVSGAFHSPQMLPAQRQFADFITGFTFVEPVIPTISNLDARPYSAEDIKSKLVQQISGRVRWRESIHYLLQQGETDFEERTASRVLTKLVEQIKKEQSNESGVTASPALSYGR